MRHALQWKKLHLSDVVSPKGEEAKQVAADIVPTGTCSKVPKHPSLLHNAAALLLPPLHLCAQSVAGSNVFKQNSVLECRGFASMVALACRPAASVWLG